MHTHSNITYRSKRERVKVLTTITITIITDNLYLDMNGIVHSTTHGNDGVTKKMDEKLMMLGRRDAHSKQATKKTKRSN